MPNFIGIYQFFFLGTSASLHAEPYTLAMAKEYTGIKLPRSILDQIETGETYQHESGLIHRKRKKNELTRKEKRKQDREANKRRKVQGGKNRQYEDDEDHLETEKIGNSKLNKKDEPRDHGESHKKSKKESLKTGNAEDTWAKLKELKSRKNSKESTVNKEVRFAEFEDDLEGEKGFSGDDGDDFDMESFGSDDDEMGFSDFNEEDSKTMSAEDTMAQLAALKSKSRVNNQASIAAAKLKKDDKKHLKKSKSSDKSKSSKSKKIDPLSKHEAELIAGEEYDMDFYAKKLGLKGFKLPENDDGLDDILGDLDFDNFASDNESDISENEKSEDSDEDSEEDDSELLSDEEEKAVKIKENPYIAPPVKSEAPEKYVPPSRRTVSGESEELTRLKRQIKGLINRLSDANIGTIVNEISSLYATKSRNQMNTSITEIIIDSISMQGTLLDNFLVIHAGFVTAQYRSIGIEFGAFFLQTLVEKFEQESAKSERTKSANNLLSLITQLYIFKFISCKLIYDLIKKFLETFSEANVEFLLQIVRSAGSQLRSDDPSALKDIIILLQTKVSQQKPDTIGSRTKFLVESIRDVKNNKTKQDNEVTAAATQKMRKFLGNFGKADPIQVNLDDLHNAETRGRWWIVGAAWKNNSTRDEAGSNVDREALDDILDTAEPNWLELARKQRMNTDIRRAIFVAVMSSEDYVDAYERIQKLHLKNKQERDIPLVILHCVASEKVYNPFYALLAGKLCVQHSFKKTFQFALWDFLNGMDEDEEDKEEDDNNMKTLNYSRFFASLVGHGLMSLDILKPVNFLTATTSVKLFSELFFISLFNFLGRGAEKRQSTGIGRGSTEILRDGKELAKIIVATKDTTCLQGIQYFMNAVKKSDMISGGKQKERVFWGADATSDLITEVLSHREED